MVAELQALASQPKPSAAGYGKELLNGFEIIADRVAPWLTRGHKARRDAATSGEAALGAT